MQQNILQEAYQQVIEDETFINITTITTFLHSLIYVALIFNVANRRVNNIFGVGIEITQVFQYLFKLFFSHDRLTFVILGFVLLVGYTLIYPIGEATMITYLDSEHKRASKSLIGGLKKFFPMFEFSALNGIGFNILSFFSITGIVYSAWVLDNWMSLYALGIWFLFILTLTVFRPYVKFCIVLEDMNVTDAIKKSTSLAMGNFSLTLRFLIITFLLRFRFILNTIFIIGIPLLLVYIALQKNRINTQRVDTVIYGTVAVLFIITAYINGIIEAFFMTYRFKLYKYVK